MAVLHPPSTTVQSPSLLSFHPILTVKSRVSFLHSPKTLQLIIKKNQSTILTSATSSKEQTWTHEGEIIQAVSNGMYKVKLQNGDVILGHVSGKIRKSKIRVLDGDKVEIEVSRYDSTQGRITYRLRQDGSKGKTTDSGKTGQKGKGPRKDQGKKPWGGGSKDHDD